MELVATIIVLLAGVTGLALVARRVHLPYPAVMVVAGLGVSLVPGLPVVRMDPEVVLLVFLPPLIYSAAWQQSWRDFRGNLRPILSLAIGFVGFTTVVVGVVMHGVVPGMTWAAALALGAIVSPPDAVAATAVLGRVGVRRRIQVILEGESLVNDASGLLLYRLAVVAAVAGGLSVGRGVGLGVWMIVGGVVIGLLVGWVVMWVQRRVEEPTIETVLTLLTPYAASLPAEAVGVSSVLAVAVMGLYVSHNSARLFTVRSRLRAVAVWEVVEFLLNGAIFVMMGLQLRVVAGEVGSLSSGTFWGHAGLLVGVVMLARVAWVVPVSRVPWLRPAEGGRGEAGPTWGGVMVVALTGMRGVISLAAALAIPAVTKAGEAFPKRGLIIVLTFVVILVTLVSQSLALPWVVRKLGAVGGDWQRCEEWEARLLAVRAALRRLEEVGKEPGRGEAVGHLRELYREQERALAAAAGEDGGGGGECRVPVGGVGELRRELIDVQREELLKMFEEERIDEGLLQRLQIDLDMEELRLPGRGKDQ